MHRIVFLVSWKIPLIGFAQTARDYAVLMQTTAQSEVCNKLEQKIRASPWFLINLV